VRITVVKRSVHEDLIDAHIDRERYPDGLAACGAFADGQSFVVEDFPRKPDGFCDWAWADIQRDVAMILFGASMPWIRQPETAITCCTDGLRPVSFRVERIEEKS
jgi:uncharacterized repeat protein (TIGR04076 family)